MLITGLIIYLSEIFIDNDISGNKTLLIGVNVIILGLFVIVYRNKITVVTNLDRHRISYQIVSNLYIKLLKILKTNQSEFLVFGSLFALLIVSTNYLYGGITIGDQWYHQNRIIYFMSGQFKEYLIMNGDDILSASSIITTGWYYYPFWHSSSKYICVHCFSEYDGCVLVLLFLLSMVPQ